MSGYDLRQAEAFIDFLGVDRETGHRINFAAAAARQGGLVYAARVAARAGVSQ